MIFDFQGVAADETDVKTKSIVYEEQKKFKNPTRDWPEKGVINFKDLYLRYSEDLDDACVLKGLNCTFNSHEKVIYSFILFNAQYLFSYGKKI